jgi:hypothetical protein
MTVRFHNGAPASLRGAHTRSVNRDAGSGAPQFGRSRSPNLSAKAMVTSELRRDPRTS